MLEKRGQISLVLIVVTVLVLAGVVVYGVSSGVISESFGSIGAR